MGAREEERSWESTVLDIRQLVSASCSVLAKIESGGNARDILVVNISDGISGEHPKEKDSGRLTVVSRQAFGTYSRAWITTSPVSTRFWGSSLDREPYLCAVLWI